MRTIVGPPRLKYLSSIRSAILKSVLCSVIWYACVSFPQKHIEIFSAFKQHRPGKWMFSNSLKWFPKLQLYFPLRAGDANLAVQSVFFFFMMNRNEYPSCIDYFRESNKLNWHFSFVTLTFFAIKIISHELDFSAWHFNCLLGTLSPWFSLDPFLDCPSLTQDPDNFLTQSLCTTSTHRIPLFDTFSITWL